MSDHERYEIALLDNFIRAAGSNLAFTTDQLVGAIKREKERDLKDDKRLNDQPNGAIVRKWYTEVINILETAQVQIRAASETYEKESLEFIVEQAEIRVAKKRKFFTRGAVAN